MKDILNLEDNLTLKSKFFFSKSYIESSMIFSKNACAVESKESDDYYDNSNHQANVISSILFSVLYLESTINEFYINVADGLNLGRNIKPEFRDKIIEFWQSDKLKSFSILQKYQSALSFMDRNKFDENFNPFQNIKILISLRNYLVHYKPEWVEMKENEDDVVQLANLEKKLIRKFEIRKNSGIGTDIFPNKYLSYGCTTWAISNSIQFVNEFYEKLNVEYFYKEIIFELKRNYEAKLT